ncbi:GLPGLI family protein [Faecalibacter rhinopitheci]|uniref:GLPGLI family protein n=1 Tax=Faecalibacter rhinopitheci TaxID=2779678 RepID=A0A8J7FRX6_9FLAO|nr:GLPGLI family protein [Faecalibacter rhinopitheci]MBF0597508.1 GLPGLI family protein [Faecalibacter rhinopitheci]
MKKLLFTFALGLISTSFTIAQDNKSQNIEATYINEIKLDYEATMKTIPQQLRSQVGDLLKAEIDAGIFMTYHLKSNGKNSSFKLEEKINNSQNSTGFIAQQMAAMDKHPYYKDLSTTPSTYYKEVDAGVKQYLIKEAPNFNWKTTREKAEIAGYKVNKAEGVMMDSIKVTAWYAPEITVKDGPQTLSGLPGLIIKAEYESSNAKMIFTLKELKISDKELKVNLPTKGTLVSEKEFMEEMLKLQAQFKEMMGGGVDTN